MATDNYNKPATLPTDSTQLDRHRPYVTPTFSSPVPEFLTLVSAIRPERQGGGIGDSVPSILTNPAFWPVLVLRFVEDFFFEWGAVEFPPLFFDYIVSAYVSDPPHVQAYPFQY